jgi:protein-S-isoprenylcysteine O-methyltransferase Ste14
MEKHELRAESTPGTLIAVRAAVRFLVVVGVWGGLLFWAAGTIAWVRAWFLLGLWAVTLTVNLMLLLWANPDVVAARMKRQRGAARFEWVMLPLFILAVLAIPVVAGLDAVRYAWTSIASWTIWPGDIVHATGYAFVLLARVVTRVFIPAVLANPIVIGLDVVRYAWTSIPAWTMWPAIVAHVMGDALMLWAMVVNPHLEGVVRIQSERGHRVVAKGPYSIVRHPMYVGLILLLAGIPLLLGSGWAFLPVGVGVVLLVIRTALEDRMLRKELPGYEEYARKTIYRLVPGVW